MGYRELFIVLTSVVLLTLLMTQINTNTVQGRDALQELEMQHTAAAIAQQFIEEAKSKNFDGQVGLVNPMESDFFTPAGSLGPGAGETYPNFNDVDDYDELNRTVYANGGTYDPNSTSGIPFNVSILVEYVSEANPDSAVTYETYLKRMSITVISIYMPGSIAAKHVFSYYGVNLL